MSLSETAHRNRLSEVMLSLIPGRCVFISKTAWYISSFFLTSAGIQRGSRTAGRRRCPSGPEDDLVAGLARARGEPDLDLGAGIDVEVGEGEDLPAARLLDHGRGSPAVVAVVAGERSRSPRRRSGRFGRLGSPPASTGRRGRSRLAGERRPRPPRRRGPRTSSSCRRRSGRPRARPAEHRAGACRGSARRAGSRGRASPAQSDAEDERGGDRARDLALQDHRPGADQRPASGRRPRVARTPGFPSLSSSQGTRR